MKFELLVITVLYSAAVSAQDSLNTKVASKTKSASELTKTATTAASSQVKTAPKPAPKKSAPAKTFTPRKKVVDLTFFYTYYQLYKKVDGFDSSKLWHDGKLKKTFDNKGSIQHNTAKNTLRWRLKGESDNEYYNINTIVGDNYARTISGIRYFRFKDDELGPSVACYYPEQSIWIIYRQNVPPLKK